MIERLKQWAAEMLTTGFALGLCAVVLVLVVAWALYDLLYNQPDERL